MSYDNQLTTWGVLACRQNTANQFLLNISDAFVLRCCANMYIQTASSCLICYVVGNLRMYWQYLTLYTKKICEFREIQFNDRQKLQKCVRDNQPEIDIDSSGTNWWRPFSNKQNKLILLTTFQSFPRITATKDKWFCWYIRKDTCTAPMCCVYLLACRGLSWLLLVHRVYY